MKRMSPPWAVAASPTTTPGTVVRSALSGRCGGAPSASATNATSIEIGAAAGVRRPRCARRRCARRPCGRASRSGARGSARPPRACTRAPRARSPRRRATTCSGVQAVGLELLRHQVAPRDRELVAVGVARQLDHLHAVEERRRDRGQGVGGGDEQHLREVEGHLEVVVAEASSSARGRAPRAAPRTGRRGSRRRACRSRRAGTPGSASRRGAGSARCGPASRRRRCGGDRGSPPRRARRRGRRA